MGAASGRASAGARAAAQVRPRGAAGCPPRGAESGDEEDGWTMLAADGGLGWAQREKGQAAPAMMKASPPARRASAADLAAPPPAPHAAPGRSDLPPRAAPLGPTTSGGHANAIHAGFKAPPPNVRAALGSGDAVVAARSVRYVLDVSDVPFKAPPAGQPASQGGPRQVAPARAAQPRYGEDEALRGQSATRANGRGTAGPERDEEIARGAAGSEPRARLLELTRAADRPGNQWWEATPEGGDDLDARGLVRAVLYLDARGLGEER